jgi:cell fate regulator YaaT (PSP1 superfamily)
MSEFIEITFKGERKEGYANPMQFPFRVGDFAIVEADKGEDLGMVNQLNPLPDKIKNDKPIKKILRRPSAQDLQNFEGNRQKEDDAFIICREKIVKCNLPMKLVDVEYQFDGNKITFYFTAEKRVDFRELVKELAATYRVRIELRQIGVRDEAKRLSGYSVCGRRLCCTTFLKNFEPITTQFAKDQLMPLNPQKLSGVCGRLMCCLNYEREFYLTELKKYPPIDSLISTPKGKGMVEKIDVFKEEIVVRFQNNEWEKYKLNELGNS